MSIFGNLRSALGRVGAVDSADVRLLRCLVDHRLHRGLSGRILKIPGEDDLDGVALARGKALAEQVVGLGGLRTRRAVLGAVFGRERLAEGDDNDEADHPSKKDEFAPAVTE